MTKVGNSRGEGDYTRVVLAFAALSCSAAAASLELTIDPATGEPGKFAAAEILRAAGDNGMVVRDEAAATRIALDVGVLALFDMSGDKFEHDEAQNHLINALNHWKQYAAIRDAHYVPALYNRMGYVDVTALTTQVAADIAIARNWKRGSLKGKGKGSGTEKGFRQ